MHAYVWMELRRIPKSKEEEPHAECSCLVARERTGVIWHDAEAPVEPSNPILKEKTNT